MNTRGDRETDTRGTSCWAIISNGAYVQFGTRKNALGRNAPSHYRTKGGRLGRLGAIGLPRWKVIVTTVFLLARVSLSNVSIPLGEECIIINAPSRLRCLEYDWDRWTFVAVEFPRNFMFPIFGEYIRMVFEYSIDRVGYIWILVFGYLLYSNNTTANQVL